MAFDHEALPVLQEVNTTKPTGKTEECGQADPHLEQLLEQEPSAPAMPRRIQRKRTAGWRMPKDAVYVGRPTKWGNPFTPQRDSDYYCPKAKSMLLEWAADVHRDWLQLPAQADLVTAIRSELRGKDLACWCPEGQPCHADTLLRVANSGGEA